MKKLQEELVKERAERERLEELLLCIPSNRYSKCGGCNFITDRDEGFSCEGLLCQYPSGIVICSSCDEYTKCRWCSRKFCSSCKNIDLLKCERGGCDVWFCLCTRSKSTCRNKHILCLIHREEKCRLCEALRALRTKHVKAALTTTLGLLRRKDIRHKDIYRDVFVILLRQMWAQTRDTSCWDLRPLLKKKQLL